MLLGTGVEVGLAAINLDTGRVSALVPLICRADVQLTMTQVSRLPSRALRVGFAMSGPLTPGKSAETPGTYSLGRSGEVLNATSVQQHPPLSAAPPAFLGNCNRHSGIQQPECLGVRAQGAAPTH